MKKNFKITIGVVAVLALVACIGGGKLVLDRASAANEGLPEPKSTQTVQATDVPEGEDSNRFAVPTPIPTGSGAQATTDPQKNGEATVTEDEDGNVTIVPNWEAKAQYSKPVENAPDANIGGSGGGKMDLEDGVYRGDHPGEETPAVTVTPKPSATPTPTPTPTPVATPTPTPEQTPVVTPAPTPKPSGSGSDKEPTPTDKPQPQEPDGQTPVPTPAPTPTPSQPSGGGSTPPDYSGSHDGEISPDGKYEYWAMFDEWVERGNGSQSIPGKGTHTQDGGDVVGEM